MEQLTRERIAALQAESLPHVRWDDILGEGATALTVPQVIDLDDYFHIFTPIPRDTEDKQFCLYCRSHLPSGVMGAVLGSMPGNATLEWGIAHGEAFCSACGYPYRVYHYDIGGKGEDALIKRLVLSLPYHPDEISFKERDK